MVVDPAETLFDAGAVVALMTETFGVRGDEMSLLEGWLKEPSRCVRVALGTQGEVLGLDSSTAIID